MKPGSKILIQLLFSAFEFLIWFSLNYFLPVSVSSVCLYMGELCLFELIYFPCDVSVCFFVMPCDILLKIWHLKKASTSPMICGMDSQIRLA